MTGKQDQIIPGFYRQHILAGVIIAGRQPVSIDTHGGGAGADGSQIVATSGCQLMITLYDAVAATAYAQVWLAEEHLWVFDGLPPEIPVVHGQGSIGPGGQRSSTRSGPRNPPVRLGLAARYGQAGIHGAVPTPVIVI